MQMEQLTFAWCINHVCFLSCLARQRAKAKALGEYLFERGIRGSWKDTNEYGMYAYCTSKGGVLWGISRGI